MCVEHFQDIRVAPNTCLAQEIELPAADPSPLVSVIAATGLPLLILPLRQNPVQKGSLPALNNTSPTTNRHSAPSPRPPSTSINKHATPACPPTAAANINPVVKTRYFYSERPGEPPPPLSLPLVSERLHTAAGQERTHDVCVPLRHRPSPAGHGSNGAPCCRRSSSSSPSSPARSVSSSMQAGISMSPKSLSDLPLEIIQDILRYVVVPANLPFLARLRLVCIFVALEATGALLGKQGLMGCRLGIASSPVPFLARYFEYRLARSPSPLPDNRNANIESRLKWLLDELLGSKTKATAARLVETGQEEVQLQQGKYYAALLALCHHMSDYQPEFEDKWWGGEPGWCRNIQRRLDTLTPPVPRNERSMKALNEVWDQDALASLLPAAIALGLEAVYEPAIANAKQQNAGSFPVYMTHVGSHRVDLEALSSCFGTPLYAAVKARNPALVTYLLDSGVLVTADRSNPMAAAAKNDDMDMLNLFLEPPCQLAPDAERLRTVLGLAARLGRTAFVQRILDFNRLEPRRAQDRDWGLGRALLMAVFGGHVETAEFLIDNGAPFQTNARPYLGSSHGLFSTMPTLVELAAWQGDLSMLRLLLSRQALVTIESAHAAMAGNRVEALCVLLETKSLRMDQYAWCRVLSAGAKLDCTEAILYLVEEARVLDIPGILESGDPEAVYLSEVVTTLCSRGNRLALEALIQTGLPVDHNCTLDPDDEVNGGQLSVHMNPMDLATNSLAPGAQETVRMLTRYGAPRAPKRAKQYMPCDWAEGP
ncbi:uncharacterized protein PG986_002261 [Apiospora aurea]|uniref:Ankyrin n=1 Tax=Apiospora aurea TaxID=335848 RepID=A0ABR1QZD7_9PEZI